MIPLETELGKEPFVLARLVLLLERFLDGSLGFLTLRRAFVEGFFADDVLNIFNVKSVTSGHNVVVVDELDERLNFASLLSLFLAVLLGNLLGVRVNTGNKSVTELVGLGTIILRLDDNDLLTSVLAADDNG